MERKLVLYYRLVTGLIGLLTLGLVIMSVQLWYVGRSVVALNQALLEIHRIGQHSAAVTREVAGRLLTGRPVVAAALEECPVVRDLERLASAVRGDRHLEGLVWETTRQHRSIHNVLTLLETTASGLRPGDGRVEASRYFTEELLPAVSGLDALLARIQETLTSRLEGMWAGYRIFHWLVTAGGLAFTVAGLIFLAVFQRSIARTLTQPLARIFGLVEQAVKAEVPAGRPGDAEGEIVRLEKLVDLAARVYFRDEEAVNEIFTLWADKLGEVDFNALIQDTLAVLYNRGIILGGAYYRYDDEGERLELAVRYALPAEVETEVLPGHGPAGQCARELRVMVGWQEFDLGHGLTPRTRVKVVAAPLGLEELRGVLLVLVPAEDGDREHLIRLFTRLSRLLSLLQEKHERETERKELLEEISRQARTAEEKLAHVQAVLESSLDGICTVDREGRITAWNRGAEVITGYTAAEAIGRPCREVLGHTYTSGEPICGSHDCVLCRAFDGENVEGMEALLRTKDNRRLPIRISAAPVRVGEGGIKEIVP
ncbi:PAS domain-containing protein [Thermanaeromonas sp. C210]|uniref:PAS domain-containing protein n=1 Tax=Thermanaeromonas sp. C210 TaxID=2731925 RepID=UPI00155C5620|nr:PAS domain-containing protein [Thermanaeromonas sp. C210]GFN22880.1 hypothetical protein TAMC210_11970 [Thermanaeromonas sp. C210]